MKLVFLTPEYPHTKTGQSGGIGTSIKNLGDALVKKNVQVSVFVYDQKEDAVFEDSGLTIHLIRKRKFLFLGWFFHRKFLQSYLNNYILSEQIDLVEAPDWTGITAFMDLKAPLIIRFHGSDTYFCHLEKRGQKKKNFWFEKLAVQNAKAFIAPTTYAGTVSRELFGIKNKFIKTIHYGLALDNFENKQPEHFEKGLLLYVGTIIRKKGVFELPKIFSRVKKQFPKAQLVMIGGDSDDIETKSESSWQLLKKQFDEEDIGSVSYLGKIPYQDIQHYIKKANVCVFPSFAETLGMVTIESMALQKPVVNTSIGWAEELIVDGESGFLVHPTDHKLFADRILNLLKNTELNLEIGRKARARVEQFFDIRNVVEQNIEFYNSIIEQY